MENNNEKKSYVNPPTKEEFYRRLEEELNKTEDWPVKYMYKFIVPNNEDTVREVKSKFENPLGFKQNFSRNGKYVSLTFITEEKSAEDIINQYKKMENIEGLIAI